MSEIENYTINEIYDLENEEIIYANDFFEKSIEEIHQIRSELQKVIEGFRKPSYVCLYCKQLVRIRGSIKRDPATRKRKYHFAHLRDSEECPIKTSSGLTKDEINRIKYNGEKEGKLHRNLKQKIADLLCYNENTDRMISNVQIERILKGKISKEWKKPDIQFEYGAEKIAIELQLSTTWLDVITKRQNFYKQNGVYILWVFHKFNIDDEQRRLTDNDVIYTNNQNAFVFNEEAINASEKEGELVLKCYYKNYKMLSEEIEETWEFTFVKLSDLTLVKEQKKIFYFDSNRIKEKAKLEFNKLHPNLEKEITKNYAEKLTFQQNLNSDGEINYDRINQLNVSLSGINRHIIEVEETIKTYKNIRENIVDFTSNLFMSFFDEESMHPLRSNEYYIDIKKQYGVVVKDILTKKQNIGNRRSDIQRKIKNINSLISVNEVKPELKIINQLKHNELFEHKLTEIGYIRKDLISPLFVDNEINWLKNEKEFNSVKFKEGVIFVFDFSLRLKELENKIRQLDKETSNLEQTSNEIKRKIQDYCLVLMEKVNKELIDELSTLEQKKEKVAKDLEAEYLKEIV